MDINNKLIDEIAKLAKLDFNEKSKVKMQDDFKKILDFINKLNEIDTKDVDPLIYISKEINTLRDDEINELISQEKALINGPLKDSDYFKVPKVINK
tara:strand:- start:846 stop:1136 length:291 start_codon:yes stop_codon:yes gene_type:complete